MAAGTERRRADLVGAVAERAGGERPRAARALAHRRTRDRVGVGDEGVDPRLGDAHEHRWVAPVAAARWADEARDARQPAAGDEPAAAVAAASARRGAVAARAPAAQH